MTALPQPQPITIAEYLAGEQHSPVKHEYLGGAVHAMSGGTNRHGVICVNAVNLLFNQLRGKPCQPFNSDTKVRIELPDHTRFYYPDAMVVCHPNPLADTYQEHPVVVIEVLSESTRRIDTGEKRDAYLAIPSLKVLLLVEPDEPVVTAYRRRTEGGFATERHCGMAAVIPLPEIGATLDLAALYDRAEIPV
ncbi:MAG: Uma2 family endonuclease [Akkermansiaceae bacterium]|jgi:Uma2 family endonuclease|nr:Uma2 family endonuclease [Akkermansiaceae bacterium]